MVRIVFAILKEAPEPLSTHVLPAKTMARRGFAGGVTKLHLKRVRKCLDRQKARGALIGESLGGVLCWRVR